jgi:hypothetical protein
LRRAARDGDVATAVRAGGGSVEKVADAVSAEKMSLTDLLGHACGCNFKAGELAGRMDEVHGEVEGGANGHRLKADGPLRGTRGRFPRTYFAFLWLHFRESGVSRQLEWRDSGKPTCPSKSRTS